MPGGGTFQLDLVTHVDFRIAFSRGGHCGVASEVLLPHEKGDLGGVYGQEHGLFLGYCEPSADHQYFLAGKELAIAGGAVGHTATSAFGLPFKPEFAWVGTGGDENFVILPAIPLM